MLLLMAALIVAQTDKTPHEVITEMERQEAAAKAEASKGLEHIENLLKGDGKRKVCHQAGEPCPSCPLPEDVVLAIEHLVHTEHGISTMVSVRWSADEKPTHVAPLMIPNLALPDRVDDENDGVPTWALVVGTIGGIVLGAVVAGSIVAASD